jgi:hypothetical protein
MFKKIISYLSFSACCFASGPDDFLTHLPTFRTGYGAGLMVELSFDRTPLIRKKTQLDVSIDELEKKVINLLKPTSLTDEKLETTASTKMQSVAYCWSFSPLTFQFTQKLQAVLKTPPKENFFTEQPLEIIGEIYSYLELEDFICLANISKKTKSLAEKIFENTNLFEKNFPRYTGTSKDLKTYKKLLTRAYSSVELFKRFYEENQKNKKTLSSLKTALEVIECLSPESPVKTEVLKELRDFIKKKEAEIKPGSISVIRNSVCF